MQELIFDIKQTNDGKTILMPLYTVEVEWSGYSRGIATYLVSGENEEYARAYYSLGEEITYEVVRDDTSAEIVSIELTSPYDEED